MGSAASLASQEGCSSLIFHHPKVWHLSVPMSTQRVFETSSPIYPSGESRGIGYCKYFVILGEKVRKEKYTFWEAPYRSSCTSYCTCVAACLYLDFPLECRMLILIRAQFCAPSEGGTHLVLPKALGFFCTIQKKRILVHHHHQVRKWMCTCCGSLPAQKL